MAPGGRNAAGCGPALRRCGFGGLLLLALLAATPAAALLPEAGASGDTLYQRECGICHGPAGHGDGSEAPTFVPPPRDLAGDFLARRKPEMAAERIRRSRLRMLAIDDGVVEKRRKRMSEEIAGYLQRLPAVDWPRARRGADVYAERCESCHGPYARPVTATALQRGDPRPTSAPPRPDFQKALGDAELLRSARGAHVALPRFVPVASDDDARALLVYLRLLSTGHVRYSLWCAGCHGDEGRGDGPFASGIDQPGFALDRAYLAAQSPAELRRKIMHALTDEEAAVPHYQRDLTPEQARAVVAALGAMAAASATPAPPPGAPHASSAATPRAAPTPAGTTRAARTPPPR